MKVIIKGTKMVQGEDHPYEVNTDLIFEEAENDDEINIIFDGDIIKVNRNELRKAILILGGGSIWVK